MAMYERVILMLGFLHRNSFSKNGKRLPVFSIALVFCYLAVAVLFFIYGFGVGKAPVEPPEEVVAAIQGAFVAEFREVFHAGGFAGGNSQG